MSQVIDVVMPEQHEGTRATVLRWCRNIGERVTQNEPLVELETDKVTVEIPAPASGELVDILKAPNEAVEPHMVLGRLRTGASADAGKPEAAPDRAPAARREAESRESPLSPAVRRLLAEHGLQPGEIAGSGRDGRITAQDILRHVESRAAQEPVSAPSSEPARGVQRAASLAAGASRKVPHSAIRRRIAEHMVASVASAPHVTTLFEADLSQVIRHRERHAAGFERRGAKLTLTAYFVAASVRAIEAVPEANATFHADHLEIHADANVGVGTALGNEGLIVPVLHRAQTLDLFEVSRRLGDLVAQARAGRLAPEAVRGGTFTISNHGVSGSILAAPIVINQPQVAILGVGKLERRVVVHEVDGEDVIRVRPMCYVTLTIDHRALDAFQANAFLGKLVKTLEEWPVE
jgi:2-oxoglutarate dehydrogenase E2 component (dihydrolipoamide succinyltransferase)